MKWVNVHNSSSADNFELLEDEKVLAGISFTKQARFARMVSHLGKRMFLFEKKGFLKPARIIKNEYGVRLGSMETLKDGKGYVELDGKKYAFVFNKDNSGELVLYDEGMQKSLFTCSFNVLNLGINKTKSLLDSKFASLLLVLCWYAFQQHGNASVSTMLKDTDHLFS